MHAPDGDYRTSAPTMLGALQIVKGWSQAHPGHVPLAIQLELKASWPWSLPSLEGRVAFTTPPPGHADSAFIMHNDPRGQGFLRIRELVNRGYLVRTRSDDPVSTAKANGHRRPTLALASGAHMISTDFPVPGLAFRWGDGTFVSRLPDGCAVRPNPVTARCAAGE